MLLDRDQFVITYDPDQADHSLLLSTIRGVGYTARVVSDKASSPSAPAVQVLPRDIPLLDEALARARKEQKPLVIDFFAEWCAPCRRMEKTTFVDERVKAMLERCVFLRIDTDSQPELSRRMNVEGLPDIRFVTPDGKVVGQLRNYQDAESFAEELDRLLRLSSR
jgi:thiol:disulfide interchange protein